MTTDDDDFFNSGDPGQIKESEEPKKSSLMQPVEDTPPNVAKTTTSSRTNSIASTTKVNNSTIGPNSSIQSLVQQDKTSRIPQDFDFSKVGTIKVVETERRVEQGNGLNNSTYVTYLVEVRPHENGSEGSESKIIPYSSLWRRFSEFDQLRDFLIVTYPHVIVPVIPCKTMQMIQKNLKSQILYGHKAARRDNLDSPFSENDALLQESRKIELERFLNKVINHPELKFSEIFWSFLQDTNQFTFKLKATGYNARLNALNTLVDQVGKKAGDIVNKNENLSNNNEEQFYNKLEEIEDCYRDFVNAYKEMTLAEFSTVNVYENYTKVFQLLGELELTYRKELTTAAPLLQEFVEIVRVHQDFDMKSPLSKLSEIERTYRKSLRNAQAIHYRNYQNEVKYAQMKLDETKLERATLASGSVPKNISSLRGFGSMLKAVVETNFEREARGKKMERREQLEEQLVDKTASDFNEFKELGFKELEMLQKDRQETTKEALKEVIKNRLAYLKKSREQWNSIYQSLNTK